MKVQKTLTAALAAAALALPANAAVKYVAADGTGDGSSWASATSDLQGAIDAASSGDQIWVKAGTYHPTKLIKSNKATSKAFILKDGVSLYGGFAGTETSLEERARGAKEYEMTNETILSADDDSADAWTRTMMGNTTYRWGWDTLSNNNIPGTKNNSTHVIYCEATLTNQTVVDGFTLTGGNANIWQAKAYGGGVYGLGTITVSGCKIVENSSYFTAEANDSNSYGAAVYLIGGTLRDCYIAKTFCHSSYGHGMGGGVYAKNGTVERCEFVDCYADDEGGGAYIDGGTLSDCTFSGCYAGAGGAVYNSGGTVSNITVLDSRALHGGGVYIKGTLHNAVIRGCYADASEYSDGGTMGGGGLYNASGNASGIVSYNNTAYKGGGVYLAGGQLVNATVLNNTIREGVEGNVNVEGGTASNVLNSITEQDTQMSNFVLPTSFSGRATSDAQLQLLEGADWQLAAGSQFIDTGVVVAGFDSGTDPAGNPRMSGTQIDRGAYEYVGATRQPTITLTFAPGTTSARIGVGGATGYEFTIDWGDGEEISYTQQAYYTHAITGNVVRIYGDDIIVLQAPSQNIVGADLSRASSLVRVMLGTNGLTSLTLGNHPSLNGIYAEGNQLTSIDVSGCPALTVLDVHENNISGAIDCSAMSRLSKVDIADNNVSSLTLPKHSTVYEIDCSRNALTELDVAGLSGLDELAATENALTSIDLTGLSSMTSLYLSGNQLTGIDLSSCSSLETLQVSENAITSVDLSVAPTLTGVYVQNNALTALDVTANPSVRWLNFGGNNVSSIDVTNQRSLSILIGNNNRLTAVDLSNNASVSSVDLSNNAISSINVSAASYLSQLHLENNALTSLDVTHNSYLYGLFCGGNALTSLDLSHNSYLMTLDCSGNHLTSIDIAANTGLKGINVASNMMDAAALDALMTQAPSYAATRSAEVELGTFDISYNPGTEQADASIASAKGWTVTALYDAAPEITPTSLNIQINRMGESVNEVCDATIEYASDARTSLYIQDFMGTSARLVATIDADGNVKIAPQTCGMDSEGNYLMIVNEESVGGNPMAIYNTYVAGHFDGTKLTLEPWNMIKVPYTFAENLGTFYPECLTTEFVMSNSSMTYTTAGGSELTQALYAETDDNGVDIYGWGGYGYARLLRDASGWYIDNETACCSFDGRDYTVTDGNGAALHSTDAAARSVTFGAWKLASGSSVLRDATNAVVTFGFDLPTITGVADIFAADVQNVVYYNMSGLSSAEPFDGINIIVTTHIDGTVRTTRALIRR